MAAPKELNISGNIYIKYIDEDAIESAKLGDIMLYLFDDMTNPVVGDYDNLKQSGYLKAVIFDGMFWQQIDIAEFCTNKEYKYSRREKPIDVAMLCQEILAENIGTKLYRKYRGHYSKKEYIPNEYIRKKVRK